MHSRSTCKNRATSAWATRRGRTRVRAVFARLSLLLLAVDARAAWAYRPFDSTDAAVAERGEFELELGPIQYFRIARNHYLNSPSLVANMGVVDRCELVLQGTELVALERTPGESRGRLVDLAFLIKGVLREGSLQGKSGLSLAAEAGPLVPTPGAAEGIGAIGTIIASQRWTDATIHLDLSASRTRDGDADLFVGAILEGPYRWRVRPVIEVFVDELPPSRAVWSILNGVVMRVSDRLSLDAAIRLSRIESANVTEVRAGFTWALSLWGP